jgi:hypothetical protein
MAKKVNTKQVKISDIQITSDKISGRGGLFLFSEYLENTQLYKLLEKRFSFLQLSRKGLTISQFIKQFFAHLIDNTDTAISSFDRRKEDEAYAALLGNKPEDMASSHQIKRFFRKFICIGNDIFRAILLYLFIWRLRIEKPNIIILFGDTMVLNNDDAEKRQGVEPTYKKKKGFQPLQISWGRYMVDAIFRAGSVHSNHGDDFCKAVERLVRAIRKHYGDVPIILCTDSGFMDDDNFQFFEDELKIHYICAGKLYEDIKAYVRELPLHTFSQHNLLWQYVEFGNCLKSWSTFRRAIFTTLVTDENGQIRLEFVRPDGLLYTNIGQNRELDEKLVQAGGEEYLSATKIIELNHLRGKSELVHRSFKEFAAKEQLPFSRFGMNQAYYYFMVISHFMYEAFKYDVTYDIFPIASYPNTFRRTLIDFAVKIVAKSGKIILKVTQVVFERLKILTLWSRCRTPIAIYALE